MSWIIHDLHYIILNYLVVPPLYNTRDYVLVGLLTDAGVVWQLSEKFTLQAEGRRNYKCSAEDCQYCCGIFLAGELSDGHRVPGDTVLVRAWRLVGRDSYFVGHFIGLLDN